MGGLLGDSLKAEVRTVNIGVLYSYIVDAPIRCEAAALRGLFTGTLREQAGERKSLTCDEILSRQSANRLPAERRAQMPNLHAHY